MSVPTPTPKPSPSPTPTKPPVPKKIAVPIYVKRLVALAGATIIFLTFLVNDAKRENMKELVDSIEAAENAFQIQTDSRRTYLEIKKFEQDFAESRGQHPPKKPAPHFDTASGVQFDTWVSKNEIDWNTIDAIEDDQPLVDELLAHIAKLANRLPQGGERIATLASLKTENSDLKKRWDDAFAGADKLEGSTDSKEGFAKIEPLNLQIDSLGQEFAKHSDNVEKESHSILEEADKERATTEESYRFWTIVFRILYVFGWAAGVAGILIGANEDEVVEGLKGD
jgi:hypothetical protein